MVMNLKCSMEGGLANLVLRAQKRGKTYGLIQWWEEVKELAYNVMHEQVLIRFNQFQFTTIRVWALLLFVAEMSLMIPSI